MKNLFLFLSLIVFSTNSFAQDCTIGNLDSLGFDHDGGAILENFLLGVKFNLEQEGTLNSLNLIGRNTGAQVQMAVYDDLNGVPNDLVAETEIATVGAGILSLPVTPTDLAIGDYWIMAVYDSDDYHSYIYYSDTSQIVVYYNNLNLGADIPANASNFLSYTGSDFTYFMDIDCSTVGLSEVVTQDDIQIYPNPTNNLIHIQSNADYVSLKIYDVTGKLQREYTENEGIIDVQRMPAGVYNIVLTFENDLISKRFIKN
jgi:hypothetical protein